MYFNSKNKSGELYAASENGRKVAKGKYIGNTRNQEQEKVKN